MKKIKFFIAAALCIAVFASCKKEDNSSSNNNSSNNSSVTSVMTSGSWRVSYYHEGGDDHSTDFSGYTFTFGSSGTMTAVHSSGTTTGTWSKDDSHNEIHFSIGSSAPLNELNSGWTVISATSSEMIFKDDGNSNEELRFVKI